MPASLSVALEEERQNAVVTLTRLADVVPVNLTLSGNEITDAARTAALAWPITKQGGQTDALTPPAGVGIYRAATNLFRRGQCDTTADWLQENSGAPPAVDAATAAPFSPQSIRYPCDGTVANQGTMAVTNTGQAAAATALGVGSVYFKGVAGQSYLHRLRWSNLDATITVGTLTPFTATGAWQLLTPVPVAVAAGKTGDRLAIEVLTNGTARVDTFWVAHAMLEKGQPLVAPYVATSGGATATKPTARVQVPVSVIDRTQGWVAVRFHAGWTTTNVPGGQNPEFFSASDGSGANRIQLRYGATGGTGRWIADLLSGGVGGSNAQVLHAFNAGDLVTIVMRWTLAGVIDVSINGAPFSHANGGSGTFATPPVALTQIDVGSSDGAGIVGRQIDSGVLWSAFGKGALTDADAAALHANGNTAPDIHTAPGNPTLVWPGVTQSANTLPPAAPWPDGTTVTLERRSSQSGNVAGVRGWIERDVSGTTVAMARDWEAPFDVDLVYTATLSDGTVATGTFRIDYHACEAWLVDLARPTNSLPLVIESMSTLDYALPVGVHRVLDRRAPILTTLPAWTPSTELLVLTETLSERDRVRALYGSGYPFLLRTDPEQGVGNIYFGLTDFKEERIITLGRAPLRRFLAECVQVERPDPALFTPSPPNTYADVLAEFDDYADLLGQMETYDAMLYHIPGETTASPVTPWLPDDV
jgi:hypothetical protein